ncbi:MAG: hypothetical protein WC370_00165 [Dehalococcoidales bacterium]|jgi:hypothetical protein
MGRKARILVIAASLVAVLTLATTGVAMAAGPNSTNDKGVSNSYGQGYGLGGQGICSDNVTSLLGLTAEEIQAQRQEGLSLVQIAAAQGITEEQLIDAVMAERQARIQERVTTGTLTQERATFMLQNMEQNVVRAINRTTVGKPEWAGGNGGGQGAGNCQMTKQEQANRGNSYGEPGLGTGPGNMHKWGNNSR